MHTAVFDIETNAIDFKNLRPYTTAKVVHCLVIHDDEGTRRYRHNDTEDTIQAGLEQLSTYEFIVGHNITGFDLPVLKHLYSYTPASTVIDTLLMSQMVYGSDLRWIDVRARSNGGVQIPQKLVGRHSLDSWGHRLGLNGKDEFAVVEGEDKWSQWSQAMEDYCAHDVVINAALLARFVAKGVAYSKASTMEAALTPHLKSTTAYGWSFDVEGAQALVAKLSALREGLRQKLVAEFGSHWVRNGAAKTAKKTLNYKDPKRGDLVEGAVYQPIKAVLFNPASTDHVAYELQRKYGWEPRDFTETGKPKVDETSLRGLPYAPVPDLMKFMMLNKRLGALSEGAQAWLKVEKDGRIHAQYNQFGTRTGRMSHKGPNIAQVPRTGSPYGVECRRLFKASPGRVIVGADASGIELRLLAHYCSRYDDGQLAEVVLRGDVHTENQNAVKLHKRDSAKTFIYALLYGAGDEKLGSIIAADRGKHYAPATLKRLGKAGRTAIKTRFPGYRKLLKDVKKKAKRTKTLRAIDGRILRDVSQHNGLNTLLQGAGGIIMKAAFVKTADVLKEHGLELWVDVHMLGHIHDEMQAEASVDQAELVGACMVQAIGQTGEDYGLRVPLDGEFKVGNTWAETH